MMALSRHIQTSRDYADVVFCVVSNGLAWSTCSISLFGRTIQRENHSIIPWREQMTAITNTCADTL